MKLWNKILLTVLAGIFFMRFVNAQDCKVKVTIQTDIDSSLIYLNSKFIGKGKINIELNKGMYSVTAKEPVNRWDAKVLTDSINIQDCSDEKKINFKFNDLLYLQTEPPDVYIYAGDSLIGHSPMFVPLSDNKIILKKPNYEEIPLTLNSRNSNLVIKLNFIGQANKESFFKKNIFKIFVGGIVALGAVSAYFKLKADDSFSQYQSTGDNSLLDKTRKYDLISGITFGALQINFGLLLYYFLTD